MVLTRKFGGVGYVEIPQVTRVCDAIDFITNTVLIGHYDLWDNEKNVSIKKVIVTPDCFGLTEDDFDFEGRYYEETEEDKEIDELLDIMFKQMML